ncbi:MAG: hypothetical protein AAB824_02100 [Patescibacteria group bacterium]|mgnify:FL=1
MPKTEEAQVNLDLDELQRETEQLLALLKDRQLGVMSWYMFMRERLQNMRALTSKFLNRRIGN